ncbi:hypothetical protein BDA96_10G263300 [Sorghum bicolor]|uniref:Uncharacterized protein n=2 Tax=Sorghum bicolor TaxID=4558 RepID=A0A921U216_SORBI|nr:hypothetical protein BDA96_10G263300 [Sorghum bicolor]KXG20448.1 hypothetical protein SORBI_3010G202200 [Sorghum bicolor]
MAMGHGGRSSPFRESDMMPIVLGAPMSGLRFEIIVVKARKLDGLEEGCLMLHCLPISLVASMSFRSGRHKGAWEKASSLVYVAARAILRDP